MNAPRLFQSGSSLISFPNNCSARTVGLRSTSKSSSYKKCSKCRIRGHSGQSHISAVNEGMMKHSPIALRVPCTVEVLISVTSVLLLDLKSGTYTRSIQAFISSPTRHQISPFRWPLFTSSNSVLAWAQSLCSPVQDSAMRILPKGE
jgi:hypothetical protein